MLKRVRDNSRDNGENSKYKRFGPKVEKIKHLLQENLTMSKWSWIKVLRVAGVILGVGCFLWFQAPLTFAGILNLGNVTGMALSVVLIAYALFMPVVHKYIQKMCRFKIGKVSLTTTGVLAIICATLVVIESCCMIGACAKPYAQDATAVVLGCRVYGERASLALRERLAATYEYLSENPNAKCVVSGGQGPGEDISEAECMYRWLVDKGIDPSRIYKEDKSTSTEENIAFSQKVIEENGLFEKVAIISNEYHIFRAGMLADDKDMEWGAKPGASAGWMFPTYYVRELYAILAEWILY